MVGNPVITTPPAAEPMQLTLVKEALRIDEGDTSQDNYLNLLISTARETAETFTSRGYISQTITEYYDHFPGSEFPYERFYGIGYVPRGYFYDRGRRHCHDYLELSRSPLVEIVSVKYLDVDGNEQTWPEDQYVVNDKKDPAQITRARGVTCWPRTACQVNAVYVEYQVGYSEDGTDIPPVVQVAMLQMIADWDANRLPMKTTSDSVERLLVKNKVYYQP